MSETLEQPTVPQIFEHPRKKARIESTSELPDLHRPALPDSEEVLEEDLLLYASEEASLYTETSNQEEVFLIPDTTSLYTSGVRELENNFPLKVGTDKKPYVCRECGSLHRTPSSLQTHIRKHTGERPFACQFCDAAFAEKGTLVRHHRVHTGVRPYGCTDCAKKFSKSSDLVRHRRVHTGEKPYTCSFCPKKFADMGNMKKHMRGHDSSKDFACVHCGKTFARRPYLKEHLARHARGLGQKHKRPCEKELQPPTPAPSRQAAPRTSNSIGLPIMPDLASKYPFLKALAPPLQAPVSSTILEQADAQ